MFRPEPNPLAKKPTAPKKPEAELVELMQGREAREIFEREVLMSKKPANKEAQPDLTLMEEERGIVREAREQKIWPREKYIEWAKSFGRDEDWVDETFVFQKDGTTIVKKLFDLSGFGISSLPRGWKEIGGSLYLSDNQLTSLEGLPQKIGGYLFLSKNQLTSLEGLPKEIGGDLSLADNQITSLKGLPQKIGGHLSLDNNKLTSLEGLPQEIGGHLFLYGIPAEEIPVGLEIRGDIWMLKSQTALAEDAKRKGYRVQFSG